MIQTIKSGGAPYPDMRIEDIGLEALHELHAAVRDAGGHPPIVIDSDDLVATIRKYRPGDEVTVTYRRGDDSGQTTTLTLDSDEGSPTT